MTSDPNPGSTTAPQNKINELIALFDRGALQEALVLGETLVELYSLTVVLYKIIAATNVGLGHLKQAAENYVKVLQFEADNAVAHSNLGVVFIKLGRAKEAIASFEKALTIEPGNAETHNHLARALNDAGKPKEAIEILAKALQIKPDFPDAYYTLGTIQVDLGEHEVAATSYLKAAQFNPGYAEAFNNLGATLSIIDRHEEALDNLRKAIRINPEYAEAHSNLGATLRVLGKHHEALLNLVKAIELKPESTDAFYNLGRSLNDVTFEEPVPGLSDIIVELLEKKTYVRPSEIATSAILHLKLDPVVQSVLNNRSASSLEQSLPQTIASLSKVPLLVKLMSVCPLPDLEIEALLTNIRSATLFNHSELSNDENWLLFGSALALQCFTNEYVYFQSDKEAKYVEELSKTVGEKLVDGQQIDPATILCLASYKVLHEYSWCHLLSIPESLEDVAKSQVFDIEEERELRDDIPVLREITNRVSSKVKEQYEANPYPRWVNPGLPSQSKPVSEIVKSENLKISDANIFSTESPQILVAGCGTGLHSIETAARFENCNVLAVDLSLSSLAYAKRKTNEFEIANIEYMQADILDLANLGKTFDVIESSGVLHHMEDPMAGWKVLADCLRPGGLMRIGLYSEFARTEIVKLRSDIQLHGVESTAKEIRLFRMHQIQNAGEAELPIATFRDFFSISELRDLLFHVQEHRFTTRQLKTSLDELGLDFCGFQMPSLEMKRNFQIENPGEEALFDLEKWHQHEQSAPNIFSGMYQFWCQKQI